MSLGLAIAITAEAFKDKTDKGGSPYMLHCLHVMTAVGKKTDGDEEAMSIAVMHDLVEDTDYTIPDLMKLGFSGRVTVGVANLTHTSTDSYYDYIKWVAPLVTERLIKMADLKHNSDIHRMKGLRDKDLKRLEKYHWAYAYLRDYEEE